MIKYLEIPDLHFDMKWIDTIQLISSKIKQTIKTYNIDFVVLPGDLHNKHIVSTITGGLPVLIDIVKSWIELCPVCAVEGTPSHDGPGAYAALEEAGLVLLRPGKTYGYLPTRDKACSIIKELPINEKSDCILFGIPELNTDNIHAQLNMSAEEANAEAVNQLGKYIEHFMAPERARYRDIPAIGVLHGVVSDSASEFSDNVIIRASDIVIKTELLHRANLTRWSLGHIHAPWESEKISAGYAGSWGHGWNEVSFIPSFNIIEIINDDGVPRVHDILRVPYGTPLRDKFVHSSGEGLPSIADWLSENIDNVALWIDTDDDTLTEIPEGFHPWSRITHRVDKTESRRVTNEQAAQAKTLGDLFKLIDPAVAEPVLKKVDTIESAIKTMSDKTIDLRLGNVTVKGCDFWNGQTMTFDLSSTSGMFLVMGGNGEGKSSLAAFCSPYPIVIGKDTKSGRPSAIKDFFSGKESSIEKLFTVNGKKHRHLITIKGAHTNSSKTECYLWIEDQSQLDCGTFDEMMSKCEGLYGPYIDYLLTTFYVQPLQGKTGSSLMSATMTEIRNLVQSIAGIDREKEKRFALDRVADIEKQIESITNWLNGAEAFNINIDELKSTIENEKLNEKNLSRSLDSIVVSGKKLKETYTKLLEDKTSNDKEVARRDEDRKRDHDNRNKLQRITLELTEYNELIEMRDKLQKLLSKQIINEKATEENNKKKNEYDALVIEYRTELSIKQDAIRSQNAINQEINTKCKNDYERTKRTLEINIESIKKEIAAINKPCYYCGKIDPTAEAQIKELIQQQSESEKKTSEMIEPEILPIIDVPTELERPLPSHPEYYEVDIIAGSSDDTRKKLDDIKNAELTINSLKEKEKELMKELDDFNNKTYNIDDTIIQRLSEAETALEKSRNDYSAITIGLTKCKSIIDSTEKQIEEALKRVKEIENKKVESESLQSDLLDWKYIAAQLQPSKIPAMELDIILDEIDSEATKNIIPYRDGVLSFKTLTQIDGKKSAVDRFDIIIHDNETAKEKSFLEYSPGQKAFLNDAYVKALIKKRNDRSHRKYSPIIIDEADGPIQPDDVPAYYEMQSRYWSNTENDIMVISHAVNAHEHIQKHIKIAEVLS